MIRFACPSCGQPASAPEACAGRTTKCRQCRNPITVPAATTAAEPSSSDLARANRKSRGDRDLDDEEDDRPRRRRRSRDDDEDDDRLRRRGRKKTGANNGLLYGSIGGGVTLVIVVTLTVLGSLGRRDTPVKPAMPPGAAANTNPTLVDARKGFTTRLIRKERLGQPVPEPPANLFRRVQFDGPLGRYTACLTPDRNDSRKHPAIIWITGGDCNSIDDSIWRNGPPENDQTASAFREAGLVMMFPSLRGGNDNPGVREGFFGEVDDLLAAADYLARLSYVDPKRIYLGGHSTGGTLVFLAAECSDRFRAVFSFGPVHDVSGYPPEYIPFDRSNRREFELRAPILWLHALKCPVFVFEGTVEGNLRALELIARASTNPLVHCHPIQGGNHFNILRPITRLIAQRVVADDGASCNIACSDEELNNAFRRR